MEPGRAAAGGRGRGVGSWPGLFWVRGLAHRDTERWREGSHVETEAEVSVVLVQPRKAWSHTKKEEARKLPPLEPPAGV